MTLLIIFFLILVFVLYMKKENKERRLYEKKYEEKNTRKKIPEDRNAIAVAYFNMKVSSFLEKKYGPNIKWRYFTNVEMPQLNPVNRVVILFCDGKTEQISITRKMVFGEAVEPIEEPKPDDSSDPSDPSDPSDSSDSSDPDNDDITEWILENTSGIKKAIEKQKKSGLGFIAEYPIDQEIATDEFMNAVVKKLTENTPYDIDRDKNILHINFQIEVE